MERTRIVHAHSGVSGDGRTLCGCALRGYVLAVVLADARSGEITCKRCTAKVHREAGGK